MNNNKKIKKTKKGKKLLIIGVVLVVLAIIGSIGSSDSDDIGDTNPTTTEFFEPLSESTTFDAADVELEDAENDIPTKNDVEVVSEVETTSKNQGEYNNVDSLSYSGNAYCVINGNVPSLVDESVPEKGYETYGALDNLGRCTVAYARVGVDTIPKTERGTIGAVKPSGWHTVKYDIVDGKYLYNRCHLIGYQLTAENANTRNLITGTRYLNVVGMLPFENMVADYIKETGNTVLYRVTPNFKGDELLARGVQIEAYSVEDKGDGICFNVYCFNVQPGIEIDYATGESKLSASPTTTQENTTAYIPPVAVETVSEKSDVVYETKAPDNIVDTEVYTTKEETQGDSNNQVSYGSYIGNANTGKFHRASCSSVDSMNESNKVYGDTRAYFTDNGYVPCKRCNP